MTQQVTKLFLCGSETWVKNKYVTEIHTEEIQQNLNINLKKYTDKWNR